MRPSEFVELTPEAKAEVFTTGLFLSAVLQTLSEQHWLLTRGKAEEGEAFAKFLAVARRRELQPLADLELWDQDLTLKQIKALVRESTRLTKELLPIVQAAAPARFREFLRFMIRRMSEFVQFEEALNVQRVEAHSAWQARVRQLGPGVAWPAARPTPEENLLPASLYRAFDVVDDVLGLEYETVVQTSADAIYGERLYVGSGPGVQTSYATILTALNHLHLPADAHIVDLGSGYGRLGLIAGLWREDLRFSGYEYVGSRVRVAQAAADRAGLSSRVRFFEQDLADPGFEMPMADVYYMYDPFCQATYRRVLEHIKAVALRRAVTVVTKGDAGAWFLQLVAEGQWQTPERHDEGTLLVFRSAG